ncbi:MAG: methionine adenosyltransferase [Planctomycetota bacterium]|nr:methionine adenosyltransferase [Planctomycetota bacterium]
MAERVLFTSESVSMGHPDKLADHISDAVLDAMIAQDKRSRVACETMVTTGLALIAGEITSNAVVDFQQVVRDTIRWVGYTDGSMGMDADACSVQVALDKQSPDIAMGVNRDDSASQGAGDQGIMFGYACNETPELMPMPIQLSHRLVNEITADRKEGKQSWLRPDSKSQVTIEYDGDRPARIHTVLISTQHSPEVAQDQIRQYIIDDLVARTLPAELLDGETIYHVNPTGNFVVGGPHGDCGLTGRKIIVDTYGGMGRHGGGAFSGKDPSKVDRSAAYAARWVAKNIVAGGLADRAEIQLSYAIGVAQPLSVRVMTFGTAAIPERRIEELVREHFDLTPRGIIDSLDLLRPIFSQTASGGHFGRTGDAFTWERTDRVEALRDGAGLGAVAGA